MSRRYLLPLLAALGVVIAIVAVLRENRPHPAARPAVSPAKSPFASSVAGAGIVEAGGGNIAVGTPEPGIVAALYVTWGERVRRGTPLFKIDDSDLRARLVPALALRREAYARLQQAQGRLAMAEGVRDKRAISGEELSDRRSAVAIAAAALGTADAEVTRIRMEIGRRTVRALLPGRVLRIGVRPGEYAASGPLAVPLMVLGSERRFLLRVDIDESDAWRVRGEAHAVAFLRGNPQLSTPLRFERIEPYLVPKAELTGRSTERVDTRVLQVIYSFPSANLPNSYIGEQMDVFIEAPPPAPVQRSASSGSAAGRGARSGAR